jgi:outer membrane protein assembly factor BamB
MRRLLRGFVGLSLIIVTANLLACGDGSLRTIRTGQPSSGGGTAGTLTVTSLSPSTATVGDSGLTLTINGSNFTEQAVVQWNASGRTTTFVSAHQLSIAVSSADLAAADNVTVTVTQAGVTPNPLNFVVQADSVFKLTSAFPSVVPLGGPSYVMTVLGTAFSGSSVILWNGTSLSTTFVSETELQATVPASDIAAVGTATVQVKNSSGQTGSSNPVTVSIAAALPDAVSLLVTPSHTGAIAFNSASFPASSTWSVDVGGAPSYALVAAGKVIVTVGNELLALDQATGATVWGPITLRGAANAAYEGGSLYVVTAVPSNSNSGLMQAFDIATGRPLWSTSLPGQYFFDSGITALNGIAYTGGAGGGGTLYAVHEQTGAMAWMQSVENGESSAPAVTSDGVYVSYPCHTYDFAPATGALVWTNSTGCDGGGGGTPVATNGTLYSPNGFGTYDGATFNAVSGVSLGSYSADMPPAFGSQAGYFLKGSTLSALSSSNTVLWTFTGDGTLNTSPILVNNFVIAGGSSGNVYGLDAASGAIVWQVNVGAALPRGVVWGTQLPVSALSAGDGLLVIPAGTKITAYTLSANP